MIAFLRHELHVFVAELVREYARDGFRIFAAIMVAFLFSTDTGEKPMDLDTTKIKELIEQRERIDEELRTLISGGKQRAPQKCSLCQQEGHSARTCPQKA